MPPGPAAERSTVFSLAVWLTQMTWLVSARVMTSSLFMWMELASSKPNSRAWRILLATS